MRSKFPAQSKKTATNPGGISPKLRYLEWTRRRRKCAWATRRSTSGDTTPRSMPWYSRCQKRRTIGRQNWYFDQLQSSEKILTDCGGEGIFIFVPVALAVSFPQKVGGRIVCASD